jgi:hypothetical protein
MVRAEAWSDLDGDGGIRPRKSTIHQEEMDSTGHGR